MGLFKKKKEEKWVNFNITIWIDEYFPAAIQGKQGMEPITLKGKAKEGTILWEQKGRFIEFIGHNMKEVVRADKILRVKLEWK